MPKVISIASLKGGVGKTTLTVFLAQALPKKILCIDLDHNNNLTDYFLRETDVEEIESKSIAKAFTGSSLIQDCILKSPLGIDVIPTTPRLSKTMLSLSWDGGLQQRFRKSVHELGYDYILIDTPPALCMEMNLGIFAADLVLSPVGYSRWNFQGFDEIKAVYDLANQSLDNKIKILAIRTMVSEKKSQAMEDLGVKFAKTFIPKSESIATCVDMAKPLSEKNKSIFMELAKEIK
ncbi:ParA family protein [Leptospira sp. GIMC2001]|uniref:ParA family protein n=1 Tax=Leptospira sp. GIMC2001 TaxID=1513297 RepID=UPI0023496D60|nr:ParA family protein [Leptospira sp. GIMC2001]WCL50742.1 ParA family protein [Leptospira sp. GIMC2001]